MQLSSPGWGKGKNQMRKTGWRCLGWFIFLACLSAPPANAGEMDWAFCPAYLPQTVEVLQGQAVDLVTVSAPKKEIPDRLAVQLQTPRETILVCLGPLAFIQEQGFKLAPQDLLEVTGSRTAVGQRPVIVAREVKKGYRILRLRNPAGLPLWQTKPGEPH